MDLYLTGSNADLLSSELATRLTGRYVELRMLPLSFREYQEHDPQPNPPGTVVQTDIRHMATVLRGHAR